MGGILSLDLATNVGWAFASADICREWPNTLAGPQNPRPQGVIYGSHYIGGAQLDSGARFLNFHDWLIDQLKFHRPGLLLLEAPLPTGSARVNDKSVRIAFGLNSIADMLGVQHGAKVREAHAVEVKRHFAGTANPEIVNGCKDYKIATMRMCRWCGWEPCDQDCADALALLDYGIHKLLKVRR